jgi:hypothetical protein
MTTGTQPSITQQPHESPGSLLKRGQHRAAINNDPVRLDLRDEDKGHLEVQADGQVWLLIHANIPVEAAVVLALELADALRHVLIVPLDDHPEHNLMVEPGERVTDVLRDYCATCNKSCD